MNEHREHRRFKAEHKLEILREVDQRSVVVSEAVAVFREPLDRLRKSPRFKAPFNNALDHQAADHLAADISGTSTLGYDLAIACIQREGNSHDNSSTRSALLDNGRIPNSSLCSYVRFKWGRPIGRTRSATLMKERK